MPAALSIQERRQIVAMREQGNSFREIAEELSQNYETVRNIYQWYMESGQLKASYDNCRQQGIRSSEAVYERATQLKQAHPKWGAGLIRVELGDEFEEAELASERSLQR